MRWAKFTAIASLWAFFFAFIVLVHLWITVLRIPNRWEIISRLTCSLTFLLRRILNIKLTLVGDAGQLEGRGTVIISNHLSYVDGIQYENNSAGRKRLAADCYDRVLGRRVSSELSEGKRS
jgi:hypothetical protein